MTNEGVTVYVEIKLADERYCNGCPCLKANMCETLGIELTWVWAHHKGNDTDEDHWLRPQACIDASAEVENAVRAYRPPCTCEKCLASRDAHAAEVEGRAELGADGKWRIVNERGHTVGRLFEDYSPS